MHNQEIQGHRLNEKMKKIWARRLLRTRTAIFSLRGKMFVHLEAKTKTYNGTQNGEDRRTLLQKSMMKGASRGGWKGRGSSAGKTRPIEEKLRTTRKDVQRAGGSLGTSRREVIIKGNPKRENCWVHWRGERWWEKKNSKVADNVDSDARSKTWPRSLGDVVRPYRFTGMEKRKTRKWSGGIKRAGAL